MIVRIIHTASDQGNFGRHIIDARTRRLGRVSGGEMERRICATWKEIADRIHSALPELPNGLVVYQDSLCVELKEEIIGALKARKDFKSPNDRLLKELMERGALIEGTESLELVGEFIGIFKEVASAASASEQQKILARHTPRIQSLLKARDEYIAKRIDATLPEGGSGLLFIGEAHRVEEELEKLPSTFQIIYP
jgi:hypothetical protein